MVSKVEKNITPQKLSLNILIIGCKYETKYYLWVSVQQTETFMKTTIHFLKTRAYMGHTVIGTNGKKLTWQKLSEMLDVQVNVSVVDGFNKTYTII